MDKALLKDIKRKLFIRSAMLSLSCLDEILSINDYLSADEIMLEIIKKSLRHFENTMPLHLTMKIPYATLESNTAPQGYGEIKSNFTLFLDCQIAEDQIVLVPNSTPKLRMDSFKYISGVYVSDYKRPYIFMGDIPRVVCGGDYFWLDGICSRPVIPDFLPDKSFNPDSDKSAVYWMNIEEGYRGQYFLDLCMVNLLDFIRQMKASISLPGLPMDVMGNVDNAYMELKSKTEQEALQNGWYGELLP